MHKRVDSTHIKGSPTGGRWDFQINLAVKKKLAVVYCLSCYRSVIVLRCVLRLQGQLIGGPRIKHVCRAAAVALGQPRAMVPEDIPRLSALPLHEREGIAPSQDTEGTQSSILSFQRVCNKGYCTGLNVSFQWNFSLR